MNGLEFLPSSTQKCLVSMTGYFSPDLGSEFSPFITLTATSVIGGADGLEPLPWQCLPHRERLAANSLPCCYH